ncbi:ApbE superfamily uncharacterized protein (UPF0280 family) [Methanocalculus alkaliphilus]|uniref:UPF0280 family protein n=1 Tax=Methanocalculus alkaliphilus TaxID=768730 RepID=UPI00209F8BD7|nr:UPF0280 family protein [Methanocalculus alkaliphilus]MCP1715243.1 ApbE superfamily uncharacterized protein (UPF0280 family) [Methanocalculus alkaliphilus]
MIRRHFQHRQTITTIHADCEEHIEAARGGILDARKAVEGVCATDPFFASTFDPYDPGSDHPVIRRMVAAADEAGVGPMAAVAGTIAWSGVEAMVDAGADCGIVDNGGDIALISDRDLRIGIYAGESNRNSAFLMPPQKKITGICTSSATVGPSISLGSADAVTVFSGNVAAADAWATALCNTLTPDDLSPLPLLVETGVIGVIAVFGDDILRWGAVPPLVSARIDPNLITKGM